MAAADSAGGAVDDLNVPVCAVLAEAGSELGGEIGSVATERSSGRQRRHCARAVVKVVAGGEGDGAEAVGEGLAEGESGGADGAGGAEDGDVLHKNSFARLALSAIKQQRDSCFWAQVDGCGHGEDVGGVGRWLEAPAAQDGGEDECALHPGETFADALAGATAEGEVGEFGTGRLCFSSAKRWGLKRSGSCQKRGSRWTTI